MDRPKTYYTRAEAMDRLGMSSINAFLQLARKYPTVFVNINPNSNEDKHPWYDKAAIQKFARMRETLAHKDVEP